MLRQRRRHQTLWHPRREHHLGAERRRHRGEARVAQEAAAGAGIGAPPPKQRVGARGVVAVELVEAADLFAHAASILRLPFGVVDRYVLGCMEGLRAGHLASWHHRICSVLACGVVRTRGAHAGSQKEGACTAPGPQH